MLFHLMLVYITICLCNILRSLMTVKTTIFSGFFSLTFAQSIDCGYTLDRCGSNEHPPTMLDSAVVKALACHRCDPGSNPGVSVVARPRSVVFPGFSGFLHHV